MSLKHRQEQIILKTAKLAKWLLLLAVSLAFLTALSSWLRFSFWFELFTTYSAQLTFLVFSLLLGYIALMVFVSFSSNWRNPLEKSRSSLVALIALVLLLIHNISLASFLPERAPVSRQLSQPTVRVMTFNKLYSNTYYQQIVNYIDVRKPDILAVQEIFKAEAEVLADKLGYGHWRMAECACSAYGSDLVIFSKFPVRDAGLVFEDRLGGVLRAEIELSHNSYIAVYNTHIVPPYSSKQYSLKQNMLSRLADHINSDNLPVILAGDFNASLHSLDMRKLSLLTEEKISVIGNKPWPACTWFGLGTVFCAVIDHIFVPTGQFTNQPTIGPSMGSDHRPVDVDIALSN